MLPIGAMPLKWVHGYYKDNSLLPPKPANNKFIKLQQCFWIYNISFILCAIKLYFSNRTLHIILLHLLLI